MKFTDAQVIALAKATMIENYCERYNEGLDSETYHCEDNKCPFYNVKGDCERELYFKGFLDSYKLFIRQQLIKS